MSASFASRLWPCASWTVSLSTATPFGSAPACPPVLHGWGVLLADQSRSACPSIAATACLYRSTAAAGASALQHHGAQTRSRRPSPDRRKVKRSIGPTHRNRSLIWMAAIATQLIMTCSGRKGHKCAAEYYNLSLSQNVCKSPVTEAPVSHSLWRQRLVDSRITLGVETAGRHQSLANR